ncbi:MAG: M56 family metallopeptidase [Candidatus Acidiferrum sp.]
MSLLTSLQPALAFLISCCAKGSLLLAAGWVIAIALRRRSSAVRHHVWASAILASLALPLFAFLLPAWRWATLGNAGALWGLANTNGPSYIPHTIPSVIVNAVADTPNFDKAVIAALLIWVAGLLCILFRLAAGLGRVAWASAGAKPIFEEDWVRCVLRISKSLKIGRPVRLLLSDSPLAMPLTWGIVRPVIVLPSGAMHWPEDRRRIVLSHELAHVARHDWLIQICGELARCLNWYNPLFWLAAARLRQEGERACDDAVLLSGVTASDYASQLLELARTLENSGRAWSTALAIARPSNLERRFAAMLNPSMNRSRLSKRAKFLIPLLALTLLLPLAALRLSAQNAPGKVSGSIHDPSGTGVSNATIIMSNHAANTVDMTTSDHDGNFSFKTLPSGDYEMQVVKPGFKAYRIPQVVLESGRDFSQAILLEVGSITESLQVTPENSERPTVAATIAGKPSRLHIGGSVEASKLINKVQPVYPESAKSAGVSGTVVLHAVISMDGKPLSLRVMNSQIDPDLARSAVEAVSQWHYTPTLLNGEPIEVDTTINVVYTLNP